MTYNSKKYACECPIIPRTMPAKSVTYNSQNYAGTLDSGLIKTPQYMQEIFFSEAIVRICD